MKHLGKASEVRPTDLTISEFELTYTHTTKPLFSSGFPRRPDQEAGESPASLRI